MRLFVLASALALALGGCASTTSGPSRLTGQELDAAVALYGPWADQVEVKGQTRYIWRRSLLTNGQSTYCELRVELGFRRTIRRAYLEGFPAACELFAVRYESLTK
ncbi:hypothetical protein [Phenylobacterium soli]|nr:hypothetical protein [Phenylobacterium soli]